MRPILGRSAAWACVAACATGCGTTKMSGTVRTATEQLLLTNAWDSALQKVDFRPLAGVPIFLDTTHVTAVDQGWVVSSIREAMLSQGVFLKPKADDAQWIVEARVGAYGTDSYNWLLGVPQVNVPPTLAGVPSGTIPEIPIIKKTDQQALAKLALFAYDRKTGQVTWMSGTSLAAANAKDVYVGGLGPIQSGTIRKGPQFNGIRLPRAPVLGLAHDDAADAFATPTGTTPIIPPKASMPVPEVGSGPPVPLQLPKAQEPTKSSDVPAPAGASEPSGEFFRRPVFEPLLPSP